MDTLRDYIAAEGAAPQPDVRAIDELLNRCEWFTAARAVREHLTNETDLRLTAVSAGRGVSSLRLREVDAGRLTAVSADDIIDRFLQQQDLRIVADEEGEVGEIVTEAQLDDDDDSVSEQLAEIYLAQGMDDKAAEIYRKLSLLNPEKSVYFAQIIDKIGKN